MKRVLYNTLKGFKKRYRRLFYGECVILLYHRVADLETDPQLLAVTPSNFDSHLQHLKSNYNLLSIVDLKEMLSKRKKIPRRSVAITFDDGYADNFNNALPILKKYNAQALLYVSTCNLNTDKEFWWDEVERAILLSEVLSKKFHFIINGTGKILPTGSYSERIQAYNDLLPLLRNQNSEERIRIINELLVWSKSVNPRSSHRSMTFEELKKLALSSNAVIGAHTHNHQSLASLNKEDQYEEIKKSKDILEEITRLNISHFSYPFGTKRDYNNDTLDIVRSLGFEMVSSNYPSIVDYRSDLLQLPRYLVRNWDGETFANQLKSFFN